MRRPWPFHPLFFATYPVLLLYASNMGLLPWQDMLRPVGVILLATAVLWGFLSLILRSKQRGAAIVSVACFLFFTYGQLWSQRAAWKGVDALQDRGTFFWVWVGSCLVVLVLAGWKWKRYAHLTRFLNFMGSVLIVLAAVQIASTYRVIQTDLTKIRPKESAPLAGPALDSPDIFYVILDGYGREDEIRHYFGFDNRPFIDELIKRGFYVATSGHSNYCQTELSLASSLNMNFVEALLPGVDRQSRDRAVLDKLVDESAVAASLKGWGYQYLAITSGFPGVNPRSADVELNQQGGYSLLESALIDETPLREAPTSQITQYQARRNRLADAFRKLASLGRPAERPRFVFVHILAPHPPFVIGPNGEAVRPTGVPYGFWDGSHYFSVGGTQSTYAKGYVGQLQWVNKMVLSAVDQILRQAPKPPIIILQGDHGSRSRLDQNSVSGTDLRECFRNLNAYLVPKSVRARLYPSITPVNSFRLIFSTLFGQQLPLLPDQSYYTTWERPYVPIDITNRVEQPF